MTSVHWLNKAWYTVDHGTSSKLFKRAFQRLLWANKFTWLEFLGFQQVLMYSCCVLALCNLWCIFCVHLLYLSEYWGIHWIYSWFPNWNFDWTSKQCILSLNLHQQQKCLQKIHFDGSIARSKSKQCILQRNCEHLVK